MTQSTASADLLPRKSVSPGRARRKSRRLLRRALLVAVGVAIAGALVWAWLPSPIDVALATVEHRPMLVTVDEDGQTRVEDRFVVSAPLAGVLSHLEHEPGDRVEQGEVLARLSPLPPPLLDERSRATSRARLDAALAAQRQAAARVEAARAGWQFARNETGRMRQLLEGGSIAPVDFERSELEERAKHSELEAAELAVRVARYEAEMARAALRHLSEPASSKTRAFDVPAPVGGRVLQRLQESEAVVQAGVPLFQIGDPAALEVVVDVLTRDAVRIEPRAPVTIERWGGPPLEARVKHVEPSAFTRLSALGIEEQRVNVVIELTQPRDQWLALGDGYRIEARIQVWSGRALQAPTSAVFRDGASWAVYRVVDGRARLTHVRIGERTSRDVQILAGLTPGMRVIVHPDDRIADGVRVRER